MKKISFAKLAGLWFAVLPEFQGSVEDLQMVAGADAFLESINQDGIVECIVSDKPMLNFDFYLAAITEDGKATGYYSYGNKSLWLCDVNKYFWGGNHPQEIFVQVIEK